MSDRTGLRNHPSPRHAVALTVIACDPLSYTSIYREAGRFEFGALCMVTLHPPSKDASRFPLIAE